MSFSFPSAQRLRHVLPPAAVNRNAPAGRKGGAAAASPAEPEPRRRFLSLWCNGGGGLRLGGCVRVFPPTHPSS